MENDDSTPVYALEPATFRSMAEAQDLTDRLEKNLTDRDMGAANVRPEVVETFSEMVNNAAEHGMTADGAQAHVRYIPHRRGHALEMVVADTGPGIRATLERNPSLQVQSDTHALELAVQELISGTANPVRGIGLWITATEMQKPGRKMQLHSAGALLTIYGQTPPTVRETAPRQGTLVRLTIPC